MNKKQMLIVGIVATLLIVPIITWVVTSLRTMGTVEISVYVVPGDSVISVNDEEFKGTSVIHLKPGKYSATISKDGFISQTKDIIANEDIKSSVSAALLPSSIEATTWYNKNQSKYFEYEGKIGALEAEKGALFIQKNPITKWLPLQKAIYSIGYKQQPESDNPYKITLTIKATKGYREAALQEIRDKGFNPGDYKIEFVDYRNPFDE